MAIKLSICIRIKFLIYLLICAIFFNISFFSASLSQVTVPGINFPIDLLCSDFQLLLICLI